MNKITENADKRNVGIIKFLTVTDTFEVQSNERNKNGINNTETQDSKIGIHTKDIAIFIFFLLAFFNKNSSPNPAKILPQKTKILSIRVGTVVERNGKGIKYKNLLKKKFVDNNIEKIKSPPKIIISFLSLKLSNANNERAKGTIPK